MIEKQIRLPASANACDNLDQAVVLLRDQFVQIDVSFNFHSCRLISMLQKCGFRITDPVSPAFSVPVTRRGPAPSPQTIR
jgi:hypothetical protein